MKRLRLFLDDERPTPEGWVCASWPAEVIAWLETGTVQAVSLDHDLGDDARGTGYDVICWIEEAVALHGFDPPTITVHSANPAARLKMLAGIQAIERLAARGSMLPCAPDRPTPERWSTPFRHTQED